MQTVYYRCHECLGSKGVPAGPPADEGLEDWFWTTDAEGLRVGPFDTLACVAKWRSKQTFPSRGHRGYLLYLKQNGHIVAGDDTTDAEPLGLDDDPGPLPLSDAWKDSPWL